MGRRRLEERRGELNHKHSTTHLHVSDLQHEKGKASDKFISPSVK